MGKKDKVDRGGLLFDVNIALYSFTVLASS